MVKFRMTKSKFLKLSHSERWDVAKKLTGVMWCCEHCGGIVDNGKKPKMIFIGSRHCSNCDAMLTRRTGGGQNNPFCYFPRKIPVRK